MAFHQPVHHRVARVDANARPSVNVPPQLLAAPDESQTWILFTPGTDAGTATSYLDSVDPRDVSGRPRASDVDSLDTLARSDVNSHPQNSALSSVFLDESAAEDDAELDSLDSHLPGFRAASSPYGHHRDSPDATPVLPAHDGLGSFQLGPQGMSPEAQAHVYAFEEFNPRRIKRRRESLERGQMELEGNTQIDRMDRIEAWRLEQSRVLLDEIRKETRKRRQSTTLPQRPRTANEAEMVAYTPPGRDAEAIDLSNTEWHDQDAPAHYDATSGTWSRLTRRLIRDLLGINERLLSILLGEALPDEDEDLSSTPKAAPPNPTPRQAAAESSDESTWHEHMLGRIARELGLLVHQASTHHPGAFTTYKRMQQAPLPYAGLPAIPEAAVGATRPLPAALGESSASMPHFQPTMTQPVDIPGARLESPIPPPASETLGAARPRDTLETFTQQEWEQDLDIKLVFRYLRSRFSSSRASSSSLDAGTSHLATASTQDAAARAARVRLHHPLVSHAHGSSHAHAHARPRPAERRASKASVAPNPVALRHHHRAGSCASQSTRHSARRSSVSSRHSSRHYWDIGGSVGTGSMIASAGPMGSWGEV